MAKTQDVTIYDENSDNSLSVNSSGEAKTISKITDGTNTATVTNNKLDVNATIIYSGTEKIKIWNGTQEVEVYNYQLNVNDKLTYAVNGAITIGTSQIEAKVNASRLSNRKSLDIYNNSNKVIYYGASGVTTSNGIPIQPNQFISVSAGDFGIYLISANTGLDVRIMEWS